MISVSFHGCAQSLPPINSMLKVAETIMFRRLSRHEIERGEQKMDSRGGPAEADLSGDRGNWRLPSLQGSAERWSPGCVNAAGKAGQEW